MAKISKKSTNVPNLRFPGFEGNWMETTLGNCCQSLDYGMNAAAIEFDGANKYIRITDIDENTSKYISDFPVSPTGELDDKYLVEKNDILFARTGASTGKTYLYHTEDGKLYFAGFLIRARINFENNACFIFCQTKTSYYNNWVKLTSIRSGQPGINSQEYSSFKFWIPSKQEQDKIASFLSFIDERISTQSKIIEGLGVLKTILIKKLFAQELRFPEFNNEWNVMTLEKVCKKHPSSISANKIENNSGGYIIYGASGELKKINFYEVENDYIAIVKDGAGVGRLFYCEGKSSVLGTLDVIKPNKSINTYFLYCLLSCIDFNKYSIGSTIPHIYFKDYSNEIIGLPTIEEQIKIADFLSSIDKKIAIEKKVLLQYKTQKKFLLQNMFI